MRYIGKLETIKQIEQEIKDCTMSITTKDGSNNEDNWWGVEKTNYSKKIDVLIPNQMYTFGVRLLFDERDNIGKLQIKDRDIGWLIKVCPKMVKLLAEMKQVEEGIEQQDWLKNTELKRKTA